MNIASINKQSALELLANHSYDATDEAILDVVKLIESQLNVELANPISAKLKVSIKTQLISLLSSWCKLSSDVYKEMFRREMSKRFFKIKVPASDLTDESLIARFEVVQEQYSESQLENSKLEKSIKDLNNELNELKAKLNHANCNLTLETGKQASMRALETIVQAEQVSALATIDLQAKLVGKRNTIRNIITEPDILEILDGKQPSGSSSQPINSAGLGSSPNFTSFLLQTRRRLQTESLKERKEFNKDSRISKLMQRKNFYMVSSRQKGRIRSQIKSKYFSLYFLKACIKIVPKQKKFSQ
jgi:hypothetical protein